MKNHRKATHVKYAAAFTIVELLIVIVIIAILAAIAFVAYRGIQDRALVNVLQSDLSQASTQLALDRAIVGTFPISTSAANSGQGLTSSSGTTYQYTVDNSSSTPTFCLSGVNGSKAYHVTSTGVPEEGVCAGHTAPSGGGSGSSIVMQTTTSANCPATRTRGVDARDNHTYWVQKLADNKCWMLTNLGYAGGGTNTYSDTKTFTDGGSSAMSYTTPYYFIVPSTTNYTTEPTDPSTSTSGTGQYGYFYNWCAAMGGQTGTAACSNSATPTANTAISICPSGWRLPTGMGGEIAALNTAVNGGSTTSDAGLLTTWLGQRGGYWYPSFTSQGTTGVYWTSSPGGLAIFAGMLSYDSGRVDTALSTTKAWGFAVRCVAN